MLIDHQMVVRFVSAKARALWRLSKEQCESNPPFAEFIYNIAAAGAYDVEPDVLEEYVLERFATVQSGDPRPVDIRIAGNRIVRAQCTLLPDGSRLLTHTDVTDLVLRAEYFQERANVDVLTDLPNRHVFLNRGEAEWHRFRRYHNPFSVITSCIEGLERIGRQFGVEMVNRAVLHVAVICLREKRTTDFLARLALTNLAFSCPTPPARKLLPSPTGCETTLACYPLYIDETPIQLTISLGVAQSRAEMSGIAALLQAADDCRLRCHASDRSNGRVCG